MARSSTGPTTTEQDTINPMEVLAWLRQTSRRVRFGKDNYDLASQLIHSLISERKELNTKVDKLEAEIARLQSLSKRGPFDGQGEWGDPTNGRDLDDGGS